MALKCWGTCWENVSRNGICPGISVKWGRDTTHWIPGAFGRLSRPLRQAILCQHCSCTVHLGHLEVLPFSTALRWIAFSSPHKSLGHKKKTMHHLRLHYEVSSALLSFKHVPTINWWIHFGAGVPSLKLPRSSCRAPPAICSRQPHLDMSDMYRSRWNLQ